MFKLLKKNEEIFRYVIVGGLTTLVNLIIFYGSTYLFLDGNDVIQLQIANVISWLGAVIFAYFTNRIYVFKSKSKNIFMEAVKFMLSRVLTLLLDMLVMFIFATLLLLDYSLAKLISMVLVTIGNYIISKVLVFNEKDKACNN